MFEISPVAIDLLVLCADRCGELERKLKSSQEVLANSFVAIVYWAQLILDSISSSISSKIIQRFCTLIPTLMTPTCCRVPESSSFFLTLPLCWLSFHLLLPRPSFCLTPNNTITPDVIFSQPHHLSSLICHFLCPSLPHSLPPWAYLPLSFPIEGRIGPTVLRAFWNSKTQ